MSFWVAFLVVAAGVVVGIALGYYAMTLIRKPRAPTNPPPGWYGDLDDYRWDQEAIDLSHSSLKDVRESAKNWAASISAILGVGATVGIIKGEETFSKVSTETGNLLFWLAVASGILLGLAIVIATFAAQGTPQRIKDLDGYTLKEVSRERASDAYRLLLWSRVLTIIAAVGVFVATAIIWEDGIASDDPSTQLTAIATTEDGITKCGELSIAEDGALSMSVGGVSQPLQESAVVEPIDACPSD